MKVAAASPAIDERMDTAPFKELLLRSCGHTFENEREQALLAGLCQRMSAVGIEGHEAYFALLLRDNEELLRLTELLTVNETYFFREPDHLNLVVDKLLPTFMAARTQRPIRILSAGCSTGEEPYSIAIMLRERFGSESERLFAITAVDIDSTVIAGARRGVYGNASFRGMDPAILERYFEAHGPGKFRVDEAVRRQVDFEVVNLLGASFRQKMQVYDVILYRNVSIYFPREVQREIFGRLAELLAEGGCLLVGASETIHHDIGILSLVKQDSLFFYHKAPKIIFEERRTSSRHGSVPVRPTRSASPSVAASAARLEPLRHHGQEGARGRTGRKPSQGAAADVKACFDEAIAMAHDKQHDRALAALEAIIEQDSSFEKAYCLKGSLLLNASRFDEARTVCEDILKRDSLCLEAYLMLGMIARQNGNDDDAFRRFREALYLDSSCWLAHFYTAEILFAQRDAKRARSCYEAALKILDDGTQKEHGKTFFPLSFNAEQFIVICRHKLSLLSPQR